MNPNRFSDHAIILSCCLECVRGLAVYGRSSSISIFSIRRPIIPALNSSFVVVIGSSSKSFAHKLMNDVVTSGAEREGDIVLVVSDHLIC